MTEALPAVAQLQNQQSNTIRNKMHLQTLLEHLKPTSYLKPLALEYKKRLCSEILTADYCI
jgi:hypothetical protein